MDAQGDVAGEHDTHVPLPDRESAPQLGLRQGTEDHGDEHRCHRERLGASFLVQKAGKRSLTLNPKSAEGLRVTRRLIGDADVLVENFRPGVMDRLGFGWDELRDINPGPVYCAVSGFGADGPLSDRPAYDQIIQGLSGMMDATGTEESGPLRAGFPTADVMGGVAEAFAVGSALARRERTGRLGADPLRGRGSHGPGPQRSRRPRTRTDRPPRPRAHAPLPRVTA